MQTKFNVYESIAIGNLFMKKYTLVFNDDELFEACCRLNSEYIGLLFPIIPANKMQLYHGYIGIYVAKNAIDFYRCYNIYFISGLAQSKKIDAVIEFISNFDNNLDLSRLLYFSALYSNDVIFDHLCNLLKEDDMIISVVNQGINYKYYDKIIQKGANPDLIMRLILCHTEISESLLSEFVANAKKLPLVGKELLREFAKNNLNHHYDDILKD